MNRDRINQAALLVLRLVAGFLFWQEGASKLLGWFGGMGGHGGAAQMGTQIWVAGLLEFGGGILIVLGLLTRPVAFVLCGEMAVAYFQVHQPKGMFPVENGGQPAVLDCFIFLYLAAVGAGIYSLDAWISNRKSGE